MIFLKKFDFSDTFFRRLMAGITAIIVLYIFFRHQIHNNFTYLSSERNDGGIQVALLEHWFNVFRGLSKWDSPNYFYPYAKTLSYNEGLFLSGVIYSFFRAFTIDAFLSNELANIVIKAIGFFGFLHASRRMLNLPFLWALLGASIFTLSNNSFLQAAHAQLLTVAFSPLEAWLIYETYQALIMRQTTRLLRFGCMAVLLFSAWMLTCLYIAWFFAMFLVIAIAIQLCLIGSTGLRDLAKAVMRNKLAIMALIVLSIVSLLPFFSVYFSAENLVKHRFWEQIRHYLPSLFDSFNVGPGNRLFGNIIVSLKAGCAMCDLGNGEREAGISPILFALAGMAMFAVIVKRFRLIDQHKVLITATAASTLIMCLIPLQFGTSTLWTYVYAYWPGGSGLRVVSRIYLFLTMPATALAVLYLSRSTWPRPVVLALCALLVYEEINDTVITGLDRYRSIELTSGIPAAPPECRSFFAGKSLDTISNDPIYPIDALYPHNVDAMLIAEYMHLPTINGFASFNPPDWNFSEPANADYPVRVGEYAKAHGLKGLCKLDLISKQWDVHPELAETTSKVLAYWNFATNSVPQENMQGFGQAESLGRWTIGHEASLNYVLPPNSKPKTVAVLITVVSAMVSDKHWQRVQLSVNGKYQKDFSFRTDVHTNLYTIIPAPVDGRVNIKMKLPDAISPKEMGINGDTRQLAIVVKSIEIW